MHLDPIEQHCFKAVYIIILEAKLYFLHILPLDFILLFYTNYMELFYINMLGLSEFWLHVKHFIYAHAGSMIYDQNVITWENVK